MTNPNRNKGMAKAVADTQGENQAGFAFDTTTVTGFSHTHDSGTGGVSDGLVKFLWCHHAPCRGFNLI
jgi:putative alpha-1,2-mannosidase